MKKAPIAREQAEKEIEKYRQQVNADPHRNKLHLMPLVGLLNDPNGLIEFKGRYHIFYQWNPFDVAHGVKYWGHYSTTDFTDWVVEPIALSPDQWYDQNGCFSGSAIENEGKLYLFYTGNVRDNDGKRHTYQCLAVSEDGVHFEKKGPVIHVPKGYTAHFRDPKVWERDGQWFMVLGAQTDSLEGQVVLYQSDNLYEWKFLGPIAGNGLPGYKKSGYMWECPDFFRLGNMDILLISPQGMEPDGIRYNNAFQAGYFSGELGCDNTGFSPTRRFEELDRGFDFYAPQTLVDHDNRRIMYAWMGMSDESQDYQPTVAHRWVHSLTSPRELIWKNEKIYQRPLREMNKLRLRTTVEVEANIDEQSYCDILPCSKLAEVKLAFPHSLHGKVRLTLRDNVELEYDPIEKQFSLARKNFKNGMLEYRHCRLEELKNLHIFLDVSAIEVFLNDGEEVFTARFFTDEESNELVLQSDIKIDFQLTIWELRPFNLMERTTIDPIANGKGSDRNVRYVL